jgi:tyrosinase
MTGKRWRTARFGAILAGLVLTAAPARAACPTGVHPRQEFRTLSSTQYSRFVNAVKTLQSGPAPTAYDKLVQLHLAVAPNIHSYPAFFPWHRQFLLDFEHALQKIDPSVTIPYWDVAYDSQAPEASPIFLPSEFGGNGVGASQVVATGPFAHWQPFYPTKHGLSRSFDQGTRISPFFSTGVINAQLTQARTYDTLRQSLEFGEHGVVHNNIGGDMKAMDSPNDPLFWMLHAYLDMLWSNWQALSPANATSYGGTNFNGSLATTNDLLPGYSTVHVRDVLSITGLCYSYQSLSVAGPGPAPARDTLRGADQISPSERHEFLPTTMSVASSRSIVTPGRPVTFTASVDASAGAGHVGFFANDAGIAGCQEVPLQFTGRTWQAACTTSTLPAGSAARRITAKFRGAGAFAPSEARVAGGVRVAKSAPGVEFAAPAVAHYGDRIGTLALHATASVRGRFSYTVAPVGSAAAAEPATAKLVLPAGQYDLQANFEPADGSPGQSMTVPYVVDPAALTIRPEAKQMARGQLRPPLTWIASGFVNGDSPTVLLQQPVCLIADRSLAVGRHRILCEGGAASNYTISYPSTETLTVLNTPCVAGTPCAPAPPPGGDGIRSKGLILVCQPPIEASRVSFIGVLPIGRDGVRRTIWRGRIM